MMMECWVCGRDNPVIASKPFFLEGLAANSGGGPEDKAFPCCYSLCSLRPEQPEEILRVGDRVQLHPGTDAWMQGDRYGEILRIIPGKLRPGEPDSRPCIRVKLLLDKSNRKVIFKRSDIQGRA